MTPDREFYCLKSPLTLSPPEQFLYGDPEWYEVYRHAEWTEDMDFEQVTCPLEPRGHMRPGDRIGDLHVILPSPLVPDFLWTWYSEPIVTDHVRSLFEAAGFTGLRFGPVTVERVKYVRKGAKVEIPRLWELIVTGRGGDAHPASGIRLLYECPGCGLRKYSSFRNGIIVDEEQWDGSDFFTVNGYPRFILITEGVKDLIVENRLKNCAIVRSRDLKWQSLTRPEDSVE
jgi:hypothetical protein